MTGEQSNHARALRKPYPEFPLTPRKDGRWSKKIQGKVYTFSGTWEEALDKYRRDVEFLHRGEDPPADADPDSVTVLDLCNEFLAFKETLVNSGQLTQRSFQDYKRTATRLVDHLGHREVSTLRQSDFTRLVATFSQTMGPLSIGNEIGRSRVIFKFGFDEGLCPAMKYGQAFRRPGRARTRKQRAGVSRILDREAILKLSEAATPQLRGMILLGINAALGNSDCGQLTWGHIANEWLIFPRPKTGIARRAKLWPETIEAISALGAGSSGLVFLTKRGNPWHRDDSDSPISTEFRKLLVKCDLYRPRETGFYSLRHTFATQARRIGDDEAVKLVMGHVDDSMLGEVYTDSFPNERLEAVAEFMHDWLFQAK